MFFLKKRTESNNIGKKLQQYSDNPDFRMSYHRLSKEYTKLLKETKQKFVKNPKLFWKTIDKLKKDTKTQENPISLSSLTTYLKRTI